MSEIKLLPCPFCDSKGYTDKIGNPLYTIRCTNINCGCEVSKNTFDKAVKAWNTRKPMERILKRLGKKEELEVVAGEKGSLEDTRLDGYVKGIKKAIEVVKEEGGIDVLQSKEC